MIRSPFVPTDLRSVDDHHPIFEADRQVREDSRRGLLRPTG